MKKVLSIILVAAMLLASLLAIVPASAAEPASAPEKKVATVPEGYANTLPADAVPISKVSDLAALGAGKYGYLTQDIVIDKTTTSSTADIRGWLDGAVTTTLDGCGYTIWFNKDIDVATSDATATSIFSGAAGAIDIKNLNVKGNIVSTVGDHTGILFRHGTNQTCNIENVVVDVNYVVKSAKNGLGFLIGKTNNESYVFNNVHTYGTFIIDRDYKKEGYEGVGGFIGHANNSTITVDNCSSNVDIIMNGTIDDASVGGLFGQVQYRGKITIRSTTTSGTISIKHKNAHIGVAGFVGANMASNTNQGYIRIYDSVNGYNIIIAKDGTTDENVMRGGFVGRAYNSLEITIERCVNTGSITGGVGSGWGAAGGILAAIATYNYGWATNVNSTITIKDCVNTGEIAGAKRNGGIFGSAMQVASTNVTFTIENCANYGTINNGEGNGAGIAGILGESGFAGKLTLKNCFNAGKARAGIVHNINCYFDGSATNKEYTKTFTAPVIENCVNEGEAAFALFGTKGGALIADKLVLTNCAYTQGTVDEALFTVAAPADPDALTATVKANIHKNTNLLGIVYELIPQVDAECTEAGLKAYYLCECCDKYYNTDKEETTLDALSIPTIHDDMEAKGQWTEQVDADCDIEGTLGHYACDNCGKKYDTEWNEIADLTIPTIHSTLEFNEIVAPECEVEGTLAHYACDNCDKYYDAEWNELETIAIPTIHDTLELQPRLAPNCQETGFEAHYYCEVDGCGKYWDANKVETTYDDLVIPVGHEGLNVIPQVDPTCTETGFKAHSYCDRCETYFTEEQVETTYDALVIEKLPHVAGELVSATAATCCKNGLEAHYRCVDCGAYLPDATGTIETTEAALTTTKGHTLTYVAEKACTHTKTNLKDGTKAHYVCSDCGNYFLAGGIRVSEDALKLYAMHIYYIDNCDEENSWKECSCGKKDEDSITPLELSPDLSADAVAPVEPPVENVVDDIVDDVAEAPAAVTAPTASLSADQADADDAAKADDAKADGAKTDDTKTDDAKGCKSAIGATVVVMTATLALGATTLLKKKED